MSLKSLVYEDALDFLAVAYRRGRLVPFLGSGVSAPLPTWRSLVERLSGEIGGPVPQLPSHPTDQQLILTAERIVSHLRAEGTPLGSSVERALGQAEPTRASRAIASIWWPLVVTTNYDRMFIDAFNNVETRGGVTNRMAVLGRSAKECQTVLTGLHAPSRPILWALQGFLGDSAYDMDLRNEIVLGYEHYREVLFNNPAFRAAFMEVFRNRSLLFVGSSLSEEYFRGLFGEALVRLGTGGQSHCALVNKRQVDDGEIDPWFLHTRLNIVVLTYEDSTPGSFDGFAPALERISDALNQGLTRRNRYHVATSGNLPAVSVELQATPLIPPAEDLERWVVVSAGRDDAGLLITGDAPFVRDASNRRLVKEFENGSALFRVENQRILIAVTRRGDPHLSSGQARDLRSVAELTTHAVQAAAEGGASTVSLMFLGASPRRGRWPRVFSLVQMLRGIRRFCDEPRPARNLHIVLHDTAAADGRDVSAWYALQAGLVDAEEILDCKAIRFTVEVDADDFVRRTPLYLEDWHTVRQIAEYFVVGDQWQVEIEPNPYFQREALAAGSEITIADAGVVPGSTLRFSQR